MLRRGGDGWRRERVGRKRREAEKEEEKKE
jgi:hypothetical protein